MTKHKLDPSTFPTQVDEFAIWNRDTKTHEPKTYSAPIFERDGMIYCHSEVVDELSEGAHLFSAYDCEFREPLWVHPELEDWAKEHISPDAYWEWENPALLCLAV